MATEGFSISEAIRFGWEKFRDNVGFFIVLVLITAIISGIVSSLRTAAQQGGVGSSFIIGLLVFAVNLLIAIGIINVSLKVIDKGKGDFNDFVSAYSRFLPYLGSSILFSLIVTIGLILFVIPGIFFLLKLQFFGFFVIDKQVGAVDSLRLSWNSTRGNTGQLFLFDIVLLGIIILGAIPLGLGLFVALPVVWVALAYVYRRLETQATSISRIKPAA